MDEFGGEFRLLVERELGQMDKLTVQSEVRGEVYAVLGESADGMEDLHRRVLDELRRALGVSVSVELKPEATFERTQSKAQRIIDNRGIWRVGG